MTTPSTAARRSPGDAWRQRGGLLRISIGGRAAGRTCTLPTRAARPSRPTSARRSPNSGRRRISGSSPIALGTNDAADGQSQFRAEVSAILDLIFVTGDEATRAYWLTYTAKNPANTNALNTTAWLRAEIAARTDLAGKVTILEWAAHIHAPGVYDDDDWLPADIPHMTAQGYEKRDNFIIAALLADVPALIGPVDIYAGELTLEALYAGEEEILRGYKGTRLVYGTAPEPGTVIPDPAPARVVGIYHGGATTDLDAIDKFGATPPIASTYYIGNQVPNLTNETARINRGTRPLIAIGTKSGTISISDIASNSGPAQTWMDARIANLHTLSMVDPDITVYTALEIEFEVKVNQALAHVNGISLATYAQALDVWHTRLHANAPLVKSCYWFGGSDWTKIRTILSAMTVAPKLITFDPYRNPGASSTATFAQIAGPKLTNLTQSAGYSALGEPPVAISETGTDRSHGDPSVAAYIASIPAGLAQLDLQFALYFNRDSGPNNNAKLDGQGMPLSVAALGQAFTAHIS